MPTTAPDNLVGVPFLPPLMMVLSATASKMFERAAPMPVTSDVRCFLLGKVLEIRAVQREIWLASNRAAGCRCKLESAAAAANSIAVCLLYLQRYSLARRWFDVALRDAPPDGSVHMCIMANVIATNFDEEQRSGATTPLHEEKEDDENVEHIHTEDAITVLEAEEALEALRLVLQHAQ
jgi:hypothetical protein